MNVAALDDITAVEELPEALTVQMFEQTGVCKFFIHPKFTLRSVCRLPPVLLTLYPALFLGHVYMRHPPPLFW